MSQTQVAECTVPSGSSTQRPTIIVIGAGILGLSSALKLQAHMAENPRLRDAEVLIVAREWPGSFPGAPTTHSINYASMWAGAHARPIPATTPQLCREAAWLRQAVAEFGVQADQEPWCGVTRTLGIEYIDEPDDAYRRQDAKTFMKETGLSNYQIIPPSKLPEGVSLGFQYDTFCVNPLVYCGYLLRIFLLNGEKTMRGDLGSELEAYTLRKDVLLVVNASGVGFKDEKCFPTRGQTALTNLSIDKTVTRQYRDGTWSYLIPRFFAGGTIVGGTKEPHNWQSEPDIQTRERMLENGLSVKSFVQGETAGKDAESLKVVSDIVGRRPTRRGGMRLEVEEMNITLPGDISEKRSVLHAYGAGGRGYEISWGVAEEVANLAMPILESRVSARSGSAFSDQTSAKL